MNIPTINWTLLLGILSSLAASGLFFWLQEKQVPLAIASVSISSIIVAYSGYILYRLYLLRRMGIRGWEARISDGTSTLACIQQSQASLDFLGIAASKWLKEPAEFRRMLVRHASNGGKARFLLLNPKSEACKQFESVKNAPHGAISNTIIDNIRQLKSLQASGLPIEIRLYESPPHFRIVIVDSMALFLAIYSYVNDTGEDSPQLILDGKPREWSYYYAFTALFDRTWNASVPADRILEGIAGKVSGRFHDERTR